MQQRLRVYCITLTITPHDLYQVLSTHTYITHKLQTICPKVQQEQNTQRKNIKYQNDKLKTQFPPKMLIKMKHLRKQK